MKYIVTLNGKNYEVEVEMGKAAILNTTQAPAAQAAEPVQAAPAPAREQAPAPAAAANAAEEVIRAPMPGIILNINVAPGAAVKRGDTLLILEAMKMENEISAPCDGVVSDIAVSKGASVSTGDALLTIR